TTIGSVTAVTDNNNGTYMTTLTSAATGTATTTGTLDGMDITDETEVTIGAGAASTITTTAVVLDGTAGETTTITVQAKDAHGNILTVGGSVVSAVVSGSNPVGVTAVDNGDGTYT